MGVDLGRPLFDDGYFLLGLRLGSTRLVIADPHPGRRRIGRNAAQLLFAELPTDPPGT